MTMLIKTLAPVAAGAVFAVLRKPYPQPLLLCDVEERGVGKLAGEGVGDGRVALTWTALRPGGAVFGRDGEARHFGKLTERQF